MSSQGEIKQYLQAGQKGMPVRSVGDFIYLKDCAFPVRVIVNDQPITMDRGEKRRIERSEAGRPAFESFEIDNTHDVAAQSVTFVVGFGDYEKIIVSGEINVSSYVTTAGSGVAQSLPSDLSRDVGVVNLDTVNYVAETSVWESPAVPEGSKGVFWHDGKYYAISEDKVIRSFNRDSGAAFDDEISFSSPTLSYVRGAAMSPTGKILFKTNNDLYVMNFGQWVASEITGSNTYAGFSSSANVAYAKGAFYTTGTMNGVSDTLIRIDAVTNEQTSIAVISSRRDILVRGSTLFLGGASGEVQTAYDLSDDGLSVTRNADNDIVFEAGSGFCTEDYDLLHSVHYSSSTYEIIEARTVTTYGRLYVEPVGDTSRRVVRVLESPITYLPRGGGNVVYYDWIGFILDSMLRGDNAVSDYLTAYSHDDGLVNREVGSGTQTFALRGMTVPDELGALDGTSIGLKILPAFFD